MSSLDRDQSTTYWRSLEAFEARLETDPKLREYVENEFPEQAADLLDPVSRRRFIQLMGASMALAGVAGPGCQRWEREEIVPLSRRPEDYVPGETQYYATAFELGGVADSVLVQSYDGRPIKVEGNPQHPFGSHATTTFAQASVLHLYDPDRSTGVRGKGGSDTATWDDIENLVRGLAAGDGTGLRVLSESHGSPTLARLRDELLARFPAAKWYEYDPVSLTNDNERQGLQMAHIVPEGVRGLRAVPELDKARRIVALDADLFGTHPARLQFSAGYAKGRKPQSPDAMVRLYAVESTFTTAGAAADHRLPLPASHMLAFLEAFELAFMTIGRMTNAKVAPLPRLVEMAVEQLEKHQAKEEGAAIAVLPKKALQFCAGLAADVLDHIRASVFVAGPSLPPEVHARVAYVNALMISNGNTVIYRALPEGDRPAQLADIVALGQEMHAGQVQALLILGGNPVYTAPADVDFAGGLEKVATSVHLSEYYDETSVACTFHAPRASYLESWGDTRTYDGTYTIVQPLIEPMWRDMQNRSARTPIEMVAMLLGRGSVNGQTLVRETFARLGWAGDAAWRQALHDGFVAGSGFPEQPPRPPRKADTPVPPRLGPDALEVVFRPSTHTYDGRFANNAWLQELPDFITKLTWDNAALINPNTATQIGVTSGDLIELRVGEKTAKVPVYTLPGQARDSIAVALGHGRSRAGRVAGHVDENIEPTGFDVYGLRTSAAAYVAGGATVRVTGERYPLATTQEHWDMDQIGRDGIAERLPTLVREATAGEYAHNPEVVSEREHKVTLPLFVPEHNGASLWQEHEYQSRRGEGTSNDRQRDENNDATRYRHRWGMTIDLGKCTGCNACMVACQAENNIPVVGKTQVMRNREMHWIRIDRYFGGADLRDEPQVAYQPVHCQQCENAPCEQVCPVGATVHSEEGLNDMAYNRCVGTRYCLNNCPYKVRRFNFLDYLNRGEAVGGPLDDSRNAVRKLLFNPEVTVRSRGVMEKCTFCVQRIQKTKIEFKNQGQEVVPDGAIQTACQQACPTDAIVFGDLNDESSAVAVAQSEKRAYPLLEAFNTRPRNLYLARIRNPNPYLG